MNPTKQLLLFLATPRVGSSVLAEDLRASGLLGAAAESFHQRQLESIKNSRDLHSYITEQLLIDAHSRPTFSACIMWPHMRNLENILDGQNPFEFFSEAFNTPEISLVRISRQDKLRQAISLVRALQTGMWGSKRRRAGEEHYDRESIERAVLKLVKDETSWDACLERWEHKTKVHLVYENDLFTKEDRNRTVANLLNLFGYDDTRARAADPGSNQGLKQQADDVTEDWIKSFLDS